MATPIQEFSNVVSRYQPGGEFSTRSAQLVDSLRKRLADEGLKSQISSGLGGREPAVTTESRFMGNVGAGFQRNLGAIRSENLTRALSAKAGFLESEQGRKAGIRETKRALRFQPPMNVIGQTPDYGPRWWEANFTTASPDQWAAKQASGTVTPTMRIHDIPALYF